MENWEIALNSFLEEWKGKDFVLGAVLTGSYATNNNTINSDIDVHIVLDDSIDWRERGNKIVNGFLIEYFANPIKQIKKYMLDDYLSMIKTDANMYSNGKIIFDKNGIVSKIQEEAKIELAKDFEVINNVSLELMKYHLFDEFENLKDNYENESFDYYYYLYLDQILNNYKTYLGAELPSKSKIFKFFTSEIFRKQYNLKKFPDDNFISLYLEAIKEENKPNKYQLVTLLKDYVLEKMGGFNIDGWKLKGSLDI